MAHDIWDDFFIESLYKKYPKRIQLAHELTDLLFIELESAYRRLRKDVAFTVEEIAKIAQEWNISLDEITNLATNKVTFTMKSINYVDPSGEEMNEIKNRIKRLQHFETSPDAECMEVCNKLPRSLTAGFPKLYQFDIFRWAYQYGNSEERAILSKTKLSKQFLQELTNYSMIIKHVANMSYIWDYRIFDYFVHDVQYFHSIFRITDKEKEQIKQELLVLLDYLLEVATNGYFPETKKKVTIYISKTKLDTNYSYFYTEELKMCRIYVFEKFDIFSFNLDLVNDFRNWMLLKRRTSFQISEIDAKSRIDFFIKQRELIEAL